MSKKRELLTHVNQLNSIRDIMGAMKNLAVLESHKLSGRLDNLRQMVADLESCGADFLADYENIEFSSGVEKKIWIIFGSERGFCGDFNDKVLRYLEENEMSAKSIEMILVGQKLATRLEENPLVLRAMEGASVAEDVSPVLDNLIAYLLDLTAQDSSMSVEAVFQNLDSRDVERRQLIPPLLERRLRTKPTSYPVDLNLPPQEVLAELMQHYLFVLLHEITYLSLMAESHDRIQHMSGAINKLDETCSDLTRRYHIERQEEITEEIEVILLNAVELD